MSFLDKIVATIAPPESDQDRAEARSKAEELSRGHGWLALALEHHRQIESAFERARGSADAAGRLQAMKQVALVLNGHSMAEEVVLYPALVEHSEKTGAAMAYEEQQMTKVQMHKLEQIDPMSQEWLDKLEHIRGAVLHHMYQEESNWFLDLARKSTGPEVELLTQRFAEEYERYAGAGMREPLSEPA